MWSAIQCIALFFVSTALLIGNEKLLSEKKNIDELKKELHVDYHTVDINVLCNRFNTDIEKGLTTAQAKEGNRTYGLNELTPPPTVSGHMFLSSDYRENS